MMRIAIVGGGAAGCFAAIEVKRRMPSAQVTLYEGGRKLLAKVAITGGGRCNLSNSFRDVKSIESVYPRGARLMKRLLREFSPEDACRWFEREGVRLVTQDDQCVFPASQDAMEIVGTLTRSLSRERVSVKVDHRVSRIESRGESFLISFVNTGYPVAECDAVLVATGGSPKASGLDFLEDLKLEFVEPVPSLFTLCVPASPITELTGIVVEKVGLSLAGAGIRAMGPLLITHWGVSGPAVLKLSSYAARHLAERSYKAQMAVNWLGEDNEQEAARILQKLIGGNPQKQLSSVYPTVFNARLWIHLLLRAGLRPDSRWAEMGKKGFNKLVAVLTNDTYTIDGKYRFKEEFVTAGGVALSNVNTKTLECRIIPNLYFAGEVLDVDAVTGGFNLQAAWTMGYVVAKSIGGKHADGETS